ncbi:hypothetical protein D018_1913A, partial [Vibrio parahaemolyticus VP2007-007]
MIEIGGIGDTINLIQLFQITLNIDVIGNALFITFE